MAKRTSRKGAAGDLLAIAVKLPWWVSLVIAVVSFVVLHAVAGQDVGSATSAKDIGGLAVKGLYRSLANIGQYIVPALFLLGAVVSVLGQRKRRSLLVRSAEGDSPAALHEMTWREFEGLVQKAFRLRGYSVRRIGGDGPDGGVDLVSRARPARRPSWSPLALHENLLGAAIQTVRGDGGRGRSGGHRCDVRRLHAGRCRVRERAQPAPHRRLRADGNDPRGAGVDDTGRFPREATATDPEWPLAGGRVGFWGENPKPCSRRLTCAG
jgi:Restriction endonuclease